VSVLEVATCFAPKFLSSHILPVLGERSALKNFLQIPAAGFLNNIGNNLAGVGEQEPTGHLAAPNW
jgi:hypothetical protein